MIQSLIDKQDNFEIVRDQIAGILLSESANQVELAVAAGKDAGLWDLRVYTERSNPWEALDGDDQEPIINIWVDSMSFDQSRSNSVDRQMVDAIFNVDAYAVGISSDSATGGHLPGDMAAAFNVQRAIRLCRNVLMAPDYMHLGMLGVVGKRWIQSINFFQPESGGRALDNIIAARLALNVHFNEFSPQYEADTLDIIGLTIRRSYDGAVLLNAQYDGTP